MRFVGLTDPGLVRSCNQDVYICRRLGEELLLCILCDGMGGERSGDVASRTAAEMLERQLARSLRQGMNDNMVRASMQSAIAAANAAVYQMAADNPDHRGMGTTLILWVLVGRRIFLAHIGDSRVYRVSGGRAEQITKDHSVVQMLVDRGEITGEEAENHPEKRYITKAVGVGPTVQEDYQELEFDDGEVYLLCSDGLSNYLPVEEMPLLVATCVQKLTAQPLINYANSQGGKDNITAVLIFE